MNIKNFYKANAEVSVTKSYQEFDNTSQTNVSKTSASKSIKVRRETTTKLDRNISYSNYGFAGTVFIPFESPIPDSFIESAILTKKYVLNVDGVDYSLQKDTGSDYVAGSYYMSEKGITFFASNLSRFPSVARLKIDGAFSNYVVIGKTGYKLENPTEYQYKTNSNGTPVLTFTFFAPDKANYLQNYRFNVNGAYVDTGSVSVFGNRFSLDIPVATLSSSNVVIPVFIQDTQGVVSNTVYLRGEQYTGLKVTNVSLGDGKNTSFTMKISGDGGGFKVGYATDFFVSINGKDYSLLGTRVPVTSSNSATSTDSYGNTVYETKYVIRLTRGGDDSVSFDFYYSQFAEGKNTITIRNAITGKTSNTITFTKGDYSNIDYGTSSATTNGSGKQAYL